MWYFADIRACSKRQPSIHRFTWPLSAFVFGPSPSLISEKKNPKSSLVTSQLGLISADKVSVELSYDVNFKWHMPIWGKICRAEQIYAIFWEYHRAWFAEKIPSMETYTNWSNAVLLIFCPQNTLGDDPAFWFFSRIHV